MTDQNSQFFAILTAVGEAKQANANALGVPWTFAQMGVGDANNTDPVPQSTQTKLINERRRAPLNQISVDPNNANIIIAEQVIPPDVGGWWIREIGLYDAAGDLVAVANCAPSFKPLLSQGTGKTQVVRLNIIVTSAANVQLKIDPAVVLATREYADSLILNVLPPNKVAGTYTQVRINDRGVVQQGSNPNTLAGYGIVDAMPKGAGGLMIGVPLVEGALSDLRTTQFISVAPDTPDRPAAIPYGTGFHVHWPGGRYAFEMLSNVLNESFVMRRLDDNGQGTWRDLWHSGNFIPALKADLASPTFTGSVRVPDAAAGNASNLAANTKFVKDAIAALVGSSPAALDTLNELAAALGNDPNFAASMNSALAGKAAKATTLAGYGITDALRVGQLSNQRPALYSTTVGGDDGGGSGGALEIREAQLVGTSNTSYAYAPRIVFHWSGITSGALAMNAGGHPAWNGKSIILAGDAELVGKADKATTLAGYGIADAYTQAQTNTIVYNTVAALQGGVGSGLDTLQKLAAAIGGDGNFSNTVQGRIDAKADKATTLAGYGIADAFTQTQTHATVSNAITALRGGVGSGFDTLQKLALALGGDGNFATTIQGRIDAKATWATTLGGYGIQDAYTKAAVDSAVAVKLDKSGGTMTGGLTIRDSNQTSVFPSLVLYNPASPTAWITASLTTDTSSIKLSHQGGQNTLYLRNHASQYAFLDAGDILSNGSACHTASTFLKPSSERWVPLAGAGTLPSGGTWAYHVTHFNSSGAALGGSSGIASGGSVVGSGNSHGFAWRIQ